MAPLTEAAAVVWVVGETIGFEWFAAGVEGRVDVPLIRP